MPMTNYRRSAGMIQTTARVLLVPGWIVALAILLKGYADVGDGFAAGVIAALIMTLQALAFGPDEFKTLPTTSIARLLAILGLFIALCIAFVPVLFGQPIFTHYPLAGRQAVHFGALEFLTAQLFDIAVFLVVYGFCLGTMVALADSEQRIRNIRRRGRFVPNDVTTTGPDTEGSRR